MMTKNPVSLVQLTEKIALELVYAEAGKDEGLLPINSLLSEMEELAAVAPPPAAIGEALSLARRSVEAALEAGGFPAAELERLGAWTKWMDTALGAVAGGQTPPPFPPALTATATATATAPVAPAPEQADLALTEVLNLNLEGDGDMLREFVQESEEHLHNIEQGVLVLEKEPKDADTLNSIFRAFHTFKGGSGFLNLTPINRLAHELESLLDLARQGSLEITSETIDVILTGGDTLKRFVTEMELQLGGMKAPEPIRVPIQGLIERIRAAMKAEGSPPAAATTAPAQPLEQPSSAPLAAPPAPSAGKTGTGFVKVDTLKLDNLVDLVGEFVIAQSLVCQNPDLLALQSPQLMRHVAQLGRITAELQKTAMSLRMVPIRSTFEKMNRLVRDLSFKVGKQVELRMSGEDTELDRGLIEELSDPLVHMIRNSVDHGLEKPAARLAAGKPAQGLVRLSASHQGGNIVIQIQDDGAGLNKERILAKAREKGLVAEDQTLSDHEIFNLIFLPGFSTAEKTTDLSGRGVGMDVVRRNVNNLRGKIDVASAPGEGSTFTIYLPLTLAIIDGLLVSVGVHRFILPTLAVRESFRPRPEMISTLHERGEMVNVRGRLCPLLRLHQHFGIEPKSREPSEAIVIVLESNHQNRCLMVDQLLGKHEVVIKSLGETFKPSRSVAGAAILGDGRVGLILDVHSLVSLDNQAMPAAA